MKKLTSVLIIAFIAVLVFGTIFSSAAEPYDTYTYSIDGKPLKSPAAYSAVDEFDSSDMQIISKFGIGLSASASDIVTDKEGNLYIADKGNNRIVVLNKYYEATSIIDSYVDETGATQTFNAPAGLFVTEENEIYICDTENKRIVVFDAAREYVKTIDKPDSSVLSDGAFVPTSVAVDKYGRVFVVSTSAYEGVIVLSGEGDFTGFIGAQEVSYTVMQKIWRRFQSAEQRKSQQAKLATAYNNIAVDDDGFVYVTTSPITESDKKNQFAAIKSKKATNSPVKKLNAQGTEIMKRNGFFDPGGEVDVDAKTVSNIIDVAVGKEKSWTILDSSRSRFFTYDQNGNLLFAFGGNGDQLGQGLNLVGMTYHVIDGEYRLVALDKTGTSCSITVYSPTQYYDAIMLALENENKHLYSESQQNWQQVLTLNNNFDLAYIGIGKALYNQGMHKEAMNYLERAYETNIWSKASSSATKDIMTVWLFPIIILVIGIAVGIMFFLSFAKKKNKATTLKVGRKTYVEELFYIFHLPFHPFDGFWDLKHEQRGSVRGALTVIGITILSFFYQSIGRGYVFNPRGTTGNILTQAAIIVVPFMLFCIANWCLTTLFDGEGSFKDIFIAAGYSLAPLPVFTVLATILTNVLGINAQMIITLVMAIGYIWVAMLLFFGTLVTHDYQMKKNIIMIVCTLVAMIVIAFIVILFFSLMMKMGTFVVSIFTEIAGRL